MGIADRDYSRPPDHGGFSAPPRPSRPGLPPVVRWLLIANVAVFMLAPGLFAPLMPSVWSRGVLVPKAVVDFDQWWRLLSCTFLHANVFHILFNMYVLFQFGPWLERHLGSRRFLAFYLLCGLAGSLLMTAFSFLEPFRELWLSQAVGASGAIYGVLLGLAVIAPNARIQLLFPPIPMSLRTFALVMVGIGLFTVGSRGANYGGELAHLGGGALGALLAWRPGLLSWIPVAGTAFGSHRQFGGRRIVDADIIEDHDRDAERIDEILDKVSAQGLHSLTGEERKRLNDYRARMK